VRFDHATAFNEIAEQPAEDPAVPVRRQAQADRLVRIIERAECDVQPDEGQIDLADLEEEDLTYLFLPQLLHSPGADSEPEVLSLDFRPSGCVPERRHGSAAPDDAPSDGPEAVDTHARRDRADDFPFGRRWSCRA
jgi:hypothetical protein